MSAATPDAPCALALARERIEAGDSAELAAISGLLLRNVSHTLDRISSPDRDETRPTNRHHRGRGTSQLVEASCRPPTGNGHAGPSHLGLAGAWRSPAIATPWCGTRVSAERRMPRDHCLPPARTRADPNRRLSRVGCHRLVDPPTPSIGPHHPIGMELDRPPTPDERSSPRPTPDGSTDLYFGPEEPAGHEPNWIQTVPGKGWFAILRLCSPPQPFFEKTWQPSETVPFSVAAPRTSGAAGVVGVFQKARARWLVRRPQRPRA